jgi:hypothetical protein
MNVRYLEELVMNTKRVGSFLGVASIAAIPLAALSISASAGAQGIAQRELFDWRGNVDQEVRVQMQGNRADVVPMGPREMIGYDNARAMGDIPAVDGYVTVQMREGRGYADVVEQPSAQNGYTTVVRVRDTQGGVGSYDVAAFWQPMSGYGYGDNAQYGQYGNYDTYNTYGAYGNPGAYQTYPQVIMEQPVYRPEYRPVHGDRDNIGGRALPAPERAHDYSQYPAQPNHAPDNGRYQNDNRSQNGNAHASRPTAPATLPSQSNHQPDRAVPRPTNGTTNGESHHDGSWQRGH